MFSDKTIPHDLLIFFVLYNSKGAGMTNIRLQNTIFLLKHTLLEYEFDVSYEFEHYSMISGCFDEILQNDIDVLLVTNRLIKIRNKEPLSFSELGLTRKSEIFVETKTIIQLQDILGHSTYNKILEMIRVVSRMGMGEIIEKTKKYRKI